MNHHNDKLHNIYELQNSIKHKKLFSKKTHNIADDSGSWRVKTALLKRWDQILPLDDWESLVILGLNLLSWSTTKYFLLLTAGLGEFKLRDLNDEINKLLREKGHWEDQILALGGPDYRVSVLSSLGLIKTYLD